MFSLTSVDAGLYFNLKSFSLCGKSTMVLMIKKWKGSTNHLINQTLLRCTVKPVTASLLLCGTPNQIVPTEHARWLVTKYFFLEDCTSLNNCVLLFLVNVNCEIADCLVTSQFQNFYTKYNQVIHVCVFIMDESAPSSPHKDSNDATDLCPYFLFVTMN